MEDPVIPHADNGADSELAKPEAEAIVEDQGQDSTTNTTTNAQQKRRASSPIPTEGAAPKSPKRAKVDDEKSDDRQRASAQAARKASIDRQEMARQEEKKRGRRLLGGLMNTLSQASAGSQHKKRQDIERRQQAKSSQQKAEEDRLRMQKLSKLEEVRKVEQLKIDEKAMKIRHNDMLAKAHFLQTRSKPHVYYLPWNLSRSQEDTIKEQIEQVEKLIQKEVTEAQERKDPRAPAPADEPVKPPLPEKQSGESEKNETIVGKPDDEPPTTDKSQLESTTATTTNDRPPSRAAATPATTNKVGPEKESDRVDDVMIEEDEDTVIY